jgi:hypothetical protein
MVVRRERATVAHARSNHGRCRAALGGRRRARGGARCHACELGRAALARAERGLQGPTEWWHGAKKENECLPITPLKVTVAGDKASREVRAALARVGVALRREQEERERRETLSVERCGGDWSRASPSHDAGDEVEGECVYRAV